MKFGTILTRSQPVIEANVQIPERHKTFVVLNEANTMNI